MMAFLETYTTLETIFLICAVIGGIGLVFRVIMMLAGGDFHADGADGVDIHDVDFGGDDAPDFGHDGIDGGHDMHDSGDGHHDGEMSFRLLSFQGLTAFFLMFGMGGLTGSRGFEWGPMQSLGGAVFAGFMMFWMLKVLFEKAMGLQSRGNVVMANAINHEGVVYLTIPPEGTGQVQIRFQKRLRTLDARSEGAVEIKTGEPVRVVRIGANDELIVERI